MDEESTIKTYSPGVSLKPSKCRRCAYSQIGQGFCPDQVVPNPLMAFWLEAPGPTEIIERRPLAGRSGESWEERYLKPLGIRRDSVLICNTLRCNPPKNEYPTAWLKRQAEELCRMHDNAIKSYDPEVWICTYHPAAVFRIPVYSRFIYTDIEKALKLSVRFRVCVVMGEKALQVLKQSAKPTLSTWHGHVWSGKYPFTGLDETFTEEELEAIESYGK